ncbi:MAG: glycosyltransferase family 4 protein [Saprospiraceae bacterium]
MNSIAIYLSNDISSDQRMQRIGKTLAHIGWSVRLIGIVNKQSLEYIPEDYSVHRFFIRPQKGIFFYAVLNLRFFLDALFSKADVLWSVDLDTLPAIRSAAWLRNKPLVWDCHEIFTAMPELFDKRFVRNVWKSIEIFFAPGLKHILTVTTGVGDFLRKEYGLNPLVIHNYPAAYPDVYSPEEKFNSRILLFQGALNHGRGLDTMIRTMVKLDSSFILKIAGKGPLMNEMEQLVQELQLQERVIFLGQLTPLELKILTPQVFLGISLLDAQHENSMVSLANKNLDYIMAGVPAITMDFPEYRLINDKWEVAILLKEPTSEFLKQAIGQLTNNFERYHHLYLACTEAREVLNWENECIKLIRFMERFK